ncbi:MAG: hypothetical protein AAFU85_28750 [Planctomycetota bacterium]
MRQGSSETQETASVMDKSKRDKAARHRAMLRILRVNRPMTTSRLRELVEAEGEEFAVSDSTCTVS